MAEMYCLVADVLGFQQIMQNVPEDARADRVRDWLHVAGDAKSWGLETQLVSDTLFAVAPADRGGLIRLVEFSKHLLEQSLFRYLPVRGAIARGGVERQADALWGDAIVKAYQRGESSDWLGIYLSESVVDVPPELYESRRLLTYPTPMKSGPIVLHPCVTWAIPEVSALAGFTTKGFLTKELEVLGWSWLRKLDATSTFRLYSQLVVNGGLPADEFRGFGATAMAEVYVDWSLPRLLPQWQELVSRFMDSTSGAAWAPVPTSDRSNDQIT